MAEFYDVMTQWRRMCETYDSCGLCDIYVSCGKRHPAKCEDLDIKTIEDKVMNWAKSHPEPVYPTWLEFVQCELAHNEPQSSNDLVAWMDNTHIPADIAQKLEIEPKEE